MALWFNLSKRYLTIRRVLIHQHPFYLFSIVSWEEQKKVGRARGDSEGLELGSINEDNKEDVQKIEEGRSL